MKDIKENARLDAAPALRDFVKNVEMIIPKSSVQIE